MSHVGIAVCPDCGARYGAEAHLVGKSIACPACGTPFVVQPVAAAAPLATSSGMPLADDPLGVPLSPATTRVLGPAIAPQRRRLPEDMPWGLLAAGAGLCIVVSAIVIGGWFAAAALGTAASEAPDASPAEPSITESLAGVAQRLAAQIPASGLADSHLSCLAEWDRIRAEGRRLRELVAQGNTSDETMRQCGDLIREARDLVIRWHALPPMTEAERQVFRAREDEYDRDSRAGREPEERKRGLNEVGLGFVSEWNRIVFRVMDIVGLAHDPVKPANELEESYDQVCQACGDLGRQIYRVKGLADCERVAPAAEQFLASVREANDRVARISDLRPSAIKESRHKYFVRLLHDEKMLEITVEHVTSRAAAEAKGSGLSTDIAPAAPDEVSKLAARLKETLSRHTSAVVAFRAAVTQLDDAAKAALARAARESPSSRLVAVASQSAPPLSDAERVAIDEAVRRLETIPFGNSVLIQVRGGDAAARERLRREIVLRSMGGRWIAIDTSDGEVIAMNCSEEVQWFAGSLTWAKVAQIDADSRALSVIVKGQFVAGTAGQRTGSGMMIGLSANRGPESSRTGGAQPASFDDKVAVTIEDYARRFGRDNVLVLTGPAATPQQRKALEDELVRLCKTSSRSSHSNATRTVFALPFSGDVQQLADQLRSVKVREIDRQKREISIAWR